MVRGESQGVGGKPEARRPRERSEPIAHPYGFTLIELLVVVAMICLLLAILLPSLRRVRDQSRAAACGSNLRQWGLTFAMYTHDNDGRFLGMEALESPADEQWFYKLRPYYGDGNDLLLCPAATRHVVRADNWPVLPPLPAGSRSLAARGWLGESAGGNGRASSMAATA
jgi:prepilin-type N-terminal cleavage/methylation domain-containing protein